MKPLVIHSITQVVLTGACIVSATTRDGIYGYVMLVPAMVSIFLSVWPWHCYKREMASKAMEALK